MTKDLVTRHQPARQDHRSPHRPMRRARKLLVTLVALAALAVAGSAQAAATAQTGTTQIWSSVGWKDGGHVYVNWHSENYDPGWRSGVLSVEVADSPAMGSDGFYTENLIDYGYVDSFANPGQWVSSYKLDPGTYYVLVKYQFEGPDYYWEAKYGAGGPRTIVIPSPPPPPPPIDESWDTCANAIRIGKSFFGSQGKWKGCRYLGANAWQPTVRRHVSKRWDVIKAINVYATGRNQGDAVIASQRRVRR